MPRVVATLVQVLQWACFQTQIMALERGTRLERTVAIKVLAKQDDDASAKLLDVALKVLPQAITEVRRPVLKDGSSWLTFRVNSFN